ncbi:1-deoxy-D-xylulose-5-phosphate synthase [candidate division WOR-3 bacterium JGI_Cruoil_03_51_56]|uniref:1-deoxy-D-xylulose-5-phosphate synthase n=1 Tax=candidate division WOR-3 bacterium JGI_Cruoil_03_51_56 TaxID=1973747 RepID=A0A235BRA7_UNCW3|nr:MAG: 1-deoxy-D-xylulose-5-phosphate synthase [candidate division WOR-3 bacterium JGI_Cruoil_03_51_56]
MGVLDKVSWPEDLKRLSVAELEQLAREIRQLIIQITAKNGGHIAPNLGAVELTLALHYVFDSPHDRIFWDVGHQCYTHKIITGRKERFKTLRQYAGISGFPKRAESKYDSFDTGHSGDSVSAALGAAVGARLQGGVRKSIVVVGDGSIAAGMVFEALNHAGALKQDLMVVLNDNEMSIAQSTGAMAGYLNRIITGRMYNRLRGDVWNLLGLLPEDLSGKARVAARRISEGLKSLVVPSVLFEELGFKYVGPVPGHDISELISTFRRMKPLRGPVLVHIVTRKGLGFKPAMDDPETFHGIGPFHIATGKLVSPGRPSFTRAFGKRMVELAEGDDRVVAITAGMCLGTGLKEFREKFPNRFFDVGICEQHAVTFSAGLALDGLRPVVAIYSTFLARALDQVIQDVCLQRLPVVLAVDRAGLVGEDGPTHHGVFDLTYLGMLPNMVVMAPKDEDELCQMLEFALEYGKGPVAIRYPRGGSESSFGSQSQPVELGKAEVLRTGKAGCVLALGAMVVKALKAAENLSQNGLDLTVVNARFVKPLDRQTILEMAGVCQRLVTVEENVLVGGFGSAVQNLLAEAGTNVTVRCFGLSDRFVEHGPRQKLLDLEGLSEQRLTQRFRNFFQK